MSPTRVDPPALCNNSTTRLHQRCPRRPTRNARRRWTGLTANTDQRDTDGDGTGDACDSTPDGPDIDGDGVGQLKDTCPDRRGPASNNGCPLDSDGDQIDDDVDHCPAQPGVSWNDGCPLSDRDGDGGSDDRDLCPDRAGPAPDGCPIPPPAPPSLDRDGDGINDSQDACPSTYGLAAYRGCPTTNTPPGGSNTGAGTHGGSKPTVPQVTSIRASGHAGKVTVSVTASGPGTVRVNAQHQSCHAGRCSWRTVRSAAARGGRATLRPAAGRYRLLVAAGNGPARTKTITVRR